MADQSQTSTIRAVLFDAAGVLTAPFSADLVGHARAGRLAEATEIHERLFPLFRALFLESNPAPAKAAMHAMGLLEDEVRLPLVSVGEGTRAEMTAVIRELGLL